MRQTLVQALANRIHIVRHPAEHFAVRLFVEIFQRQAVDFSLSSFSFAFFSSSSLSLFDSLEAHLHVQGHVVLAQTLAHLDDIAFGDMQVPGQGGRIRVVALGLQPLALLAQIVEQLTLRPGQNVPGRAVVPGPFAPQ